MDAGGGAGVFAWRFLCLAREMESFICVLHNMLYLPQYSNDGPLRSKEMVTFERWGIHIIMKRSETF